jgi:hypothetical protein
MGALASPLLGDGITDDTLLHIAPLPWDDTLLHIAPLPWAQGPPALPAHLLHRQVHRRAQQQQRRGWASGSAGDRGGGCAAVGGVVQRAGARVGHGVQPELVVGDARFGRPMPCRPMQYDDNRGITLSENGTVATRSVAAKGRLCRSAASKVLVMRSGHHFAQFTVLEGNWMLFGVIRPGWNVEGVTNKGSKISRFFPSPTHEAQFNTRSRGLNTCPVPPPRARAGR